jgi:hypothetical protein
MAGQHTHTGRAAQPAPTPTGTTTENGLGLRERWRQRRAEHRRRVIVQWLRRTANQAGQRDPIARRRQPLLHYRAAAVRSDLLEIAAALERAPNPAPASVATLGELLANGCDSPLYNPDIHVSELRATLDRVRAGLWGQDSPRPAAIGDNADRNAMPVDEINRVRASDPRHYE